MKTLIIIEKKTLTSQIHNKPLFIVGFSNFLGLSNKHGPTALTARLAREKPNRLNRSQIIPKRIRSNPVLVLWLLNLGRAYHWLRHYKKPNNWPNRSQINSLDLIPYCAYRTTLSLCLSAFFFHQRSDLQKIRSN